jgi:hypothetical protein
MRARLILPLAALLSGGTLAAQDVPLHPHSIGLRLDPLAPTVRALVPEGPAARAGIRIGDRVLAVDGRPVDGTPSPVLERALVGVRGTSVRVTTSGPGGTLTHTVPREDVFAPAAGYDGVHRTAHYIIHHRGTRAAAAFARTVAERAERIARRELRVVDSGGRRVHVWLVEPSSGSGEVRQTRARLLPAWAAWIYAMPQTDDDFGASAAYLRFGAPGPAISERLAGPYGWTRDAESQHRRAVGQLYSMDLGPETPPEVIARVSSRIIFLMSSQRAYIRERFGDRRFNAVWSSPLPFDQAVQRELGISERELLADWSAKIFGLGPSRDAGPEAAGALVALGWGMLLLLVGVVIARRKEVG